MTRIRGCESRWLCKLTSFPDNDHGQNSGCDCKINGNQHEAASKRVLAFEHTVLGNLEDDDGKSSSNTRGYCPCSKDLCNTLPALKFVNIDSPLGMITL